MAERKKILIINPPIRLAEKPSVFPSGLGYIAAYLLKEDCDKAYASEKETCKP